MGSADSTGTSIIKRVCLRRLHSLQRGSHVLRHDPLARRHGTCSTLKQHPKVRFCRIESHTPGSGTRQLGNLAFSNNTRQNSTTTYRHMKMSVSLENSLPSLRFLLFTEKVIKTMKRKNWHVYVANGFIYAFKNPIGGASRNLRTATAIDVSQKSTKHYCTFHGAFWAYRWSDKDD